MRSFNTVLAILTLGCLMHQATAQFTQCIQTCIDQYTSQSCNLADFPCICRQSSGNFLANVVSCSHDSCDDNMDSSLFLTPLSIICQLAGVPLPAAAVSSAQGKASSLAAQPVTVTVIQSPTNSGSAVVPISTTTISGAWTTATLSGNTFSWGGPTTSTYFGASTAMSTGPASSTSSTSSAISFTGTPVVIATTNSAGSTYIITPSQSSSASSQVSSLTRTSSRPSSAASSLVAGGGSSSSHTGVSTYTILTPEKTSSARSSSTTTAGGSGGTDSAPFTNTNLGTKEGVGGWFGLNVLVAFIAFWI